MRTTVDVAAYDAVPTDDKTMEEGFADLEYEAARAGVGEIGLGAQRYAGRGRPDPAPLWRGRRLAQCRSALSGRDSRSSITASTVVSPFNRAATAREIGISTSIFAASSRTAGALS